MGKCASLAWPLIRKVGQFFGWMGQCSGKGKKFLVEDEDFENAISLEKARTFSSNAAVTTARYHASPQRKLLDDYEVTRQVLGAGLCGDVVMAIGNIDRRKYAMKTFNKSKVSKSRLKLLVDEVEIYLTLDHPNIARLHDVFESDTDIFMITECCEGGELYFRLQKRGVYTNNDAADATRQMLRAVGYLHSHRIVHRDLKLENFLYESEDAAAPLKLIDFGFAKVWDPSTLMMASCGSIAYVSPDVLQGSGYTNKCDLWSLGVVVWMLLTGYPPFHGEEKEMRRKIKACEADWNHKSRWKTVPQVAVDFIKTLLQKDPALRPDAPTALKHLWLTQPAANGVPELNRDALHNLQHYAAASKVRRAALQLLAQELAPDETRDLRDHFLSIDKSNEGAICLSDFKDAIRGRRGGSAATGGLLELSTTTAASGGEQSPRSPVSPCTPARRLRRAPSGVIEELFDTLDGSGHERIYYSDFLAATMEVRHRLREEAVRATFHRLDADNSGAISVEDFREVLGETFEGVNVEELCREADPSGSGQITFDVFVRVLQGRDAVPTPSGASTSMKSAQCFFPPTPKGIGGDPKAPRLPACAEAENAGPRADDEGFHAVASLD